jgi:hypothetical protein
MQHVTANPASFARALRRLEVAQSESARNIAEVLIQVARLHARACSAAAARPRRGSASSDAVADMSFLM